MCWRAPTDENMANQIPVFISSQQEDMSGGKAVPGETSQFTLNKTADVWQIVPTLRMTLTNVAPGSSLRLSWASCLITLAAGENHQKSKEWAQTGAGSRSERCNHVWWLIVWSEECHCEGSHCAGHICLRYPLITQLGLLYPLQLGASATTCMTFRCSDWTLGKPHGTFSTMWAAGCVSTHAISAEGRIISNMIIAPLWQAVSTH